MILLKPEAHASAVRGCLSYSEFLKWETQSLYRQAINSDKLRWPDTAKKKAKKAQEEKKEETKAQEEQKWSDVCFMLPIV